jgi:hypothetical protein
MSLLFFNPLSVWSGFALIRSAETKPKPKDPKTYLLERFTPFADFQLGLTNLNVVTSGGHSRHLKQEMQSC